MKKDIHPKTNDVVFIDTSTGAEFISKSTLSSKETKEINGKTYQVIKVEISSKSHPFYTGEERIMETGRVQKFLERRKKAQELAEKKVKKVKKGDEEEVAKETAEKEQVEEKNDKEEAKKEKAEEKEEVKKDEKEDEKQDEEDEKTEEKEK